MARAGLTLGCSLWYWKREVVKISSVPFGIRQALSNRAKMPLRPAMRSMVSWLSGTLGERNER